MRKRIHAFDADISISIEEVTIEAGLTLILGLASKTICQARRAFFLLSNEERLITFFTSYVSDTHAGKTGRDKFIAKFTHSVLREVRVLASSTIGPGSLAFNAMQWSACASKTLVVIEEVDGTNTTCAY